MRRRRLKRSRDRKEADLHGKSNHCLLGRGSAKDRAIQKVLAPVTRVSRVELHWRPAQDTVALTMLFLRRSSANQTGARPRGALSMCLALFGAIALLGATGRVIAQKSGGGGSAADAGSAADSLQSFASGIVGSKHDFSDGGRIPRDLCTPCHTPHITAAQAPLLVRFATTQPVRAYDTRVAGLDAASLVCLSCHDGTVASDVYAGAHAMKWSDLSAGGVPPGRTRVINHPVGVRYPEGRRDYHSQAAVERDGRVRLPEGRIQCTTCHDPHNSANHPGMLVMSNERSRLCLACHRL